ncbi:GNAT family N-acetyltransferase [Reinekea marinisedimentorum]|uniref:Ribosomal-protein-alanine N-acetyltransferase n=1 Tax=Reinekea marinisedimentorum TaxID=230495 RepID=A0A4R3I4Z9_9GAMM|nr:GNAT family N-acetyltransferase [Reinekea marinisedimentorum]TCS40322.1 ribosomal-protein-alanine N-acetyltransferase [Reinekea marinisedimentorum]
MAYSLKLNTPRLSIVGINDINIYELVRYFLNNHHHLLQGGGFVPNTAQDVEDVYEQWLSNMDRDTEVRFFIYLKNRLIGVAGISNIVRGAFQAGYLGYSLAENEQSNGYMTEAVEEITDFGFYALNLHRIMANYRPDNIASGRVLEKAGYRKEGFAEKYLRVNGRWEDHVLTAITNDNWAN